MRKGAVLLLLLRVACALVWLLGVSGARAQAGEQQQQPASASADDDKHLGDEAMVALRYGDALVHYQRAYDATHNPAILYNMGRAHESLGDFPKALEALEEFNEKAPAELKAKVPRLQELLADVRKRVSTLIVSSNVQGADIRLGDRIVGKTRQGQQILRVIAGPKHLSVSADGYFPFDKDVFLPPAQIETLDATLASRTENGVLRVMSVTGAVVAVDGKQLGVVPAETPIAPGMHKVSLTRDGYQPAETTVVVTAGQRRDVDVPMSTKDTITKQWWFWTAVGVLVVGATVATIILVNTEKSPDSGTIAPGHVKAAAIPDLRF